MSWKNNNSRARQSKVFSHLFTFKKEKVASQEVYSSSVQSMRPSASEYLCWETS